MPVDPATADAPAPIEIGGLTLVPGDRIGPYVYRRVIGKGGMATVVLAVDPDGRAAALKILKSARMASGLARFKREFRALSRLHHPNVIRVEAYGDIHGHPYIAMEYVDGVDLHQTIHGFRGLPPEDRWRRTGEILGDLCRALAYIHRRGLIHRDLKPSNVLIDAAGRSKLTDFGIVKDLDPSSDAGLSTTLVGTWAYASPEQISGQPVDHRSDLYSLGVILFAMLTGRRPFAAKDLAGYLELHRTQRPATPRELDPSVPIPLNEICVRLLSKNPHDRFRSAQEVLFQLEQQEEDDETDRHAAWTPPLRGQAELLARLDERVAALTRGVGGAVWIEGGEGSGRTRMLEEATRRAQALGIPVCVTRVEPREPPLGLLGRIAESLARELGASEPATLTEARNAAADRERPAPNLRDRLTEGIIAGFEALCAHGPALLAVDDLHLAQVPALEALTVLLRRRETWEARALLVVATLRPDRLTPRLESLRQGGTLPMAPERLGLTPLGPDDVRAVVESLTPPGRASQALAERLHRETDGNPLFVALFLQNLMVGGILVRDGDAWRLAVDADEIASGHLEIPPGVRQVVRERLAPLDPDERDVAEAIAVHGRPLPLDVLLDVVDLDEDVAGSILDALEDLGILRPRPQADPVHVEFAHPKFGDVLYRELDLDRRADLHRRLATALEARRYSGATAAEVVGEHYRRSGDAGRAYQHLIAAAAQLVERGLLNEAGEVAARALLVEDAARVDLDDAAFRAVRRRVLQVRGEILYARGELAEARELLELALPLYRAGEEERERVRAQLQLARILRSLGQLDAAETQAEDCLGRARTLRDSEAIAEARHLQATVAWARGDLDACERHAQEGLVGAHGSALAGTRAHLLLALTAVQASRGMLASAASGLSEAQVLLRDLGRKPLRSYALSNLAEVLLAQGDLAAANQRATEALTEATEAWHRLGEMVARTVRGTVALEGGAVEEARADVLAAIAIARSGADPADTVACYALSARVQLAMGDLGAALRAIDEADRAARVSDPERAGVGLVADRAWVLARRGARAAAESLLAELEPRLATLSVLRRAQAELGMARAWWALARRDRALAHLGAASQAATRRGFRMLALSCQALRVELGEDAAARSRAREELTDWALELSTSVPAAWRERFLRRYGVEPRLVD